MGTPRLHDLSAVRCPACLGAGLGLKGEKVERRPRETMVDMAMEAVNKMASKVYLWRPPKTPDPNALGAGTRTRSQIGQLPDLIVDQDTQRGLIRIANPVLDVLIEFLKLGDGVRILLFFDVVKSFLIQLHKLTSLSCCMGGRNEIGVRK